MKLYRANDHLFIARLGGYDRADFNRTERQPGIDSQWEWKFSHHKSLPAYSKSISQSELSNDESEALKSWVGIFLWR